MFILFGSKADRAQGTGNIHAFADTKFTNLHTVKKLSLMLAFIKDFLNLAEA